MPGFSINADHNPKDDKTDYDVTSVPMIKSALRRNARHLITTAEASPIKSSSKTPPLRSLHPEGKVLERGFHRVSSHHRIYYEVHGNPDGPAAVVLHGGPGAGCSASMGRLFDLKHWKVVLFDQRGCGKSLPRGFLHSNNTEVLDLGCSSVSVIVSQKIVRDIERLRYHLGIPQWLVMGGSYGSLLALSYAQEYASRVSALVLRAVCLMRQKELDWVFSAIGVSQKLTKSWERFLSILESSERNQPIKAYYNRMLSPYDNIRQEAARHWREWTMTVMFSSLPQIEHDSFQKKMAGYLDKPIKTDRNINAFYNRTADNVAEEVKPLPRPLVQPLIEAHFFHFNDVFVTHTFPVLERINRIRDIPCIAIHGECDSLCRKDNALSLKRVWNQMDLRIIADAGHSQFDPRIKDATINAIQEMEAIVRKPILPTFHDQTPLPTYRIPEPYYKKKYR